MYSLSYAADITPSTEYGENFVIGDIVPGNYVITSDYGERKVRIEANMMTIIRW